MADEITATVRLQCDNGSLEYDSRTVRLTIDQTGTLKDGSGQNVGTTDEAMVLNSDVTPGWTLMRNCSTANYVELGVRSSSTSGEFLPVLKMLAGEFLCARLTTTSIYLQANTAACDVDKTILEA